MTPSPVSASPDDVVVGPEAPLRYPIRTMVTACDPERSTLDIHHVA